jgi:hypothetical protein
MKHKPSLLFMICAGVAALLIVGSSVLVFLSFQKLKKTSKQLKNAERALVGYYQDAPFASKANVIQEKRNDYQLTGWYSNLVAQASEGQLDLTEKRPSRFMDLLYRAQRRLLTNHLDRVTVPAKFAFGFDRYFGEGSQLPSPEQVPRLTQQLVIINRLCRMLYAEGAESISSVGRDRFEGGSNSTADRRSRRRAGAVDPDVGLIKPGMLFAKLTFTLEFVATERVVMGLLNRISRDELFIVPTRLSMRKTGNDVKLYELPTDDEGKPVASLGEAGTAVVAPEKERSRLERIVCGLPIETPMQVQLTLSVYKFGKGPDA